jgi:hypothetical protein
MRIHLYTACWNDAQMLPFFFRHYDPIVERYIVFDDGSTDGSVALLQAHPKVDLRRFPHTDSDSFVLSEQWLSNICWKSSRGHADWVLVIDLDEHLHHRTLRRYLGRCQSAGITIVPALGFQMISNEFPAPDEHLCATRTCGTPWLPMCKASIFDPRKIDEINFAAGRHRATPTGRVIVPRKNEVLNLHYKYLGFERTAARHRELSRGLGRRDHAAGWGHKYRWSDSELRADWDRMQSGSVDIANIEKAATEYPFEPWWHSWRSVPVSSIDRPVPT